MVKLRKEKILVSLVVITLIALVFGSVSSLATAPVITPTGGNTENTADTNTANTNANVNASGSISATVGASSNNTANNVNAANNEASNRNKNTNTPSSQLPYAGTSSSVVFIVIALVASALYAYKKVSDYNV